MKFWLIRYHKSLFFHSWNTHQNFDSKENHPEKSQSGHFQQVNFSSKEKNQKLKNFPSQIFLILIILKQSAELVFPCKL